MPNSSTAWRGRFPQMHQNREIEVPGPDHLAHAHIDSASLSGNM